MKADDTVVEQDRRRERFEGVGLDDRDLVVGGADTAFAARFAVGEDARLGLGPCP